MLDRVRRILPGTRAWLALAALSLASLTTSAAPTLVSTQPANNATGVSVTSPLVFVFSEAMEEMDPFPSVPPFVVGNFEITPADVLSNLSCEWSADSRTMTCTPTDDLPANTKISWKLNPAGSVLPFANTAGVPLATVSGSFTTGAGSGGGGGGGGGSPTDPKIVSVTPADGATGVPVGSSVVFVFDQAMKPIPQVGGVPPFVKGALAWAGTGLDASKFTYAWSQDSKTLTATYSANLPGNTTVTWTINPPGGVFQLGNLSDDYVATTSGSFTTGAGSGGGTDCLPDGSDPTWGTYSMTKSGSYTQTSAAAPVPSSEDPFVFGAFLTGPDGGPALASGSVTFPNGSVIQLTGLPFGGGALFYTTNTTTAQALDAAAPAGNYTLKFTPTGQAERSVPMALPNTTPPVPTISNFEAAQSIDPAASFTLSWGPFTGASGHDSISLTIHDTTTVVFQAPDYCVPRELAPTATSVVIPANTLKAGKSYQATLNFNRVFYFSTNTIPNMAGYGALSRSTSFPLNTGTGQPAATPARFTTWEVLPNGQLRLTFTGTAGRAYTLQRAAATSATLQWNNVGTATPAANGTATFQDTSLTLPTAVLYRAVAL